MDSAFEMKEYLTSKYKHTLGRWELSKEASTKVDALLQDSTKQYLV